MAADKIAGLDGFSVKFYQYFWPLLKNDLLIIFYFYHGNLDISRFNIVFLSLNFIFIMVIQKNHVVENKIKHSFCLSY
jgi:hypothetical protein